MIRKWKVILTNWINCYFNEIDDWEQNVTIESVRNILSHLRENFSLDESKSSIFEAHTVEEFVREKYPGLKFKNETVEATNEEDVYVVASLLLFFVCVNSKDVNIKNAMCSKLSVEDQEVILKFSKCLMECSPITYRDVQTAIVEACGQEMVAMESSSSHRMVSETPPALRSLHGEVRRLQAALEAERFDRNYLQEELARTNLKVDQLLKEKEQSKLEIVNLKAKISMCCGQEAETRAGEATTEGTAKLTKQLQEAEERLVNTQGQLEDAQYERDSYKAKVEELKKERDKWLATSEQEFARASQLSSELERSQLTVLELRELVGELRAHHQLNRLDSSQLECDDPDASVHSLHNASICSEACANVIEVQLGEERAKLVLLNQQIQDLQDKLNDLTQKSETEKHSLEKIISERDDDIFNLRRRINEEIEEKNNMSVHFSDGFSKLNNEINELEQKLKDNNSQLRLVIEMKMHEIQTLQEEKLSLLQSLNDETSKLENIIQKLKLDLEAERKRTEEYENHVMKLNEKVLNRNNELMELQNNVFEKSEKIESLHLELRKEKQAKEQVVEKCHNDLEMVKERERQTENKLQHKCEEINMLMDRLNYNNNHIQDINREMDYMKESISQLNENCNILEETKNMLINEISSRESLLEETRNKLGKEISVRDDRNEKLCKEMDNLKNVFREEKANLIRDFEEKNCILKKTLQDTREEMIKHKDSYSVVIDSKTRDIHTLQQENQSLNNELNDVKLQLDLKVHSLNEKLIENENVTEKLKQTYECQIENLNVMVTKLSNFLKEKTVELNKQQKENGRLHEIIANNAEAIKSLEEELKSQKNKQDKLISEFDSERLVLKNMVTVTESVMDDMKISHDNIITEYKKENDMIKEENVTLRECLSNEKKSAEREITEKEAAVQNLITNISQMKNEKEKIENIFVNEKQTMKGEIVELKLQIDSKLSQIDSMVSELKSAEIKIAEEEVLINNLMKEVSELKNEKENIEAHFEVEKQEMTREIDELKTQIATKASQIEIIVTEMKSAEHNIREKEVLINNLLKELSEIKNEKEDIKTQFEVEKQKMTMEIDDLKTQIATKALQIENIETEMKSAEHNIAEKEDLINNLLKDISEIKNEKVNIGNLFEVEKQKNTCKVDDLNSLIDSKVALIETYLKEIKIAENTIVDKEILVDNLVKDISDVRNEKDKIEKSFEMEKLVMIGKIDELNSQVKNMTENIQKYKEDVARIECCNNELKIQKDSQEVELTSEVKKITLALEEMVATNKQLQITIENKNALISELEFEVKHLNNQAREYMVSNSKLEQEKSQYEAEIEDLRSKLYTGTVEADEVVSKLKQDNLKLTSIVNENKVVVKSLEDELKSLKETKENLITEFKAEREMLKKTISVAKSVMEDQKTNMNKTICEHVKTNEILKKDKEVLKDSMEAEIIKANAKLQEKEESLEILLKEIAEVKEEKENVQKQMEWDKQDLMNQLDLLGKEICLKQSQIETIENKNDEMTKNLLKYNHDIMAMEENNNEIKVKMDSLQTEWSNKLGTILKQLDEQIVTCKSLENDVQEKTKLLKETEKQVKILQDKMKEQNECKQSQETEFKNRVDNITKQLHGQKEINTKLEHMLDEKSEVITKYEDKITTLSDEIKLLTVIKIDLEKVNNELKLKLQDVKLKMDSDELKVMDMVSKLKDENINLIETLNRNESIIKSLENELQTLKADMEKQNIENEAERMLLKNTVEAIQTAMEEQKVNYDTALSQREVLNNELTALTKEQQDNIKELKETINSEIKNAELKLKEGEDAVEIQKSKLDEVLTEHLQEIEIFKVLSKQLEEENKHLKAKMDSELMKADSVMKEKEHIMERQKENYEEVITKYTTEIEAFKEKITDCVKENQELKKTLDNEIRSAELKSKDVDSMVKELAEIKGEKENLHKVFANEKSSLVDEQNALMKQIDVQVSEIEDLELKNKELSLLLKICKEDLAKMEEDSNEMKIQNDCKQTELVNKIDKISEELTELKIMNQRIETELEEKNLANIAKEEKLITLNNQLDVLTKAYNCLEQERDEIKVKLEGLQVAQDGHADKANVIINQLTEENKKLLVTIGELKLVKTNLEQTIKQEKEKHNQMRLNNDSEKLNLNNKCHILQEYQIKAEKLLEERHKEIAELQEEVNTLKSKVIVIEKEAIEKDIYIQEKTDVINSLNKELVEQKAEKEKLRILIDSEPLQDLRQKSENNTDDVLKALRNEEWVRAVVQRETTAQAASEKTGSYKNSGPVDKDFRDFHQKVDNTTSDLTHSSMESIKTISDLEKIIYDKNRTITTLQSDITYLKSLVADSENKLLDVSKDLELSKENCQQLANQLKKIVHQKNEEIADLRKQVNKMSVTENRATQIIKVSAKYQAIILKRIAEIKSNTVLKELTNFGNSTNSDTELRRGLTAGTITMEDLENFLETTDKHIRRCSEKQIALQKERDRLAEVNRINESEIINLKKFLTELSVSFKTFSTVKDLYAQKLSRVLSVQRTVRREVLNLDGHITDVTTCKLERGYAAVMQDLTECVMNMERWVERCIGRTISPEKIKQAFTSDEERSSIANSTFQNTSLEVQLEELEKSFQKLLEEVARAQKGEGARDAAEVTLMEVRAAYEDKLNRMKAKMNQLYHEQIAAYKQKQKEEIGMLERELVKAREKMAESSRAYEEHIRALTTELWSVGEKFLTKKDEVDWLRKKQRSDSLMSLQHVHSSGLVAPPEEKPRCSDTHSLRSLPVNNNKPKREGRGLHMSDEEGEVFDNRWLKELAVTPRARARSPGLRLSELKWRNSMCPPHLKSSYPAETQFAQTFDEDDIKFSLGGPGGAAGARPQRKEVGITAYKKPGPPTPSKQAGRVSATDSELRESLRVEQEPQPSRKTSTPSRLRSLFRSNKNDTAEGTPRSRRVSFFWKKDRGQL